MLTLAPYEPWHALSLDLATPISADTAQSLSGDFSVTVMRDGLPLACGGAAEYWSGRAYVWTLIGRGLRGRDFVVTHLLTRRFLDSLPHRRLEAAVHHGFRAGDRWMRLLGFRGEGPDGEPVLARGFQADGRDCWLYARVRNG